MHLNITNTLRYFRVSRTNSREHFFLSFLFCRFSTPSSTKRWPPLSTNEKRGFFTHPTSKHGRRCPPMKSEEGKGGEEADSGQHITFHLLLCSLSRQSPYFNTLCVLPICFFVRNEREKCLNILSKKRRTLTSSLFSKMASKLEAKSPCWQPKAPSSRRCSITTCKSQRHVK